MWVTAQYIYVKKSTNVYEFIVCESPGKSGNAEGSSPAVVGSMPLHVNRRFLKPAFEECLTSVSSSSRRVASSRSKRIRSFTKKGWGGRGRGGGGGQKGRHPNTPTTQSCNE